jgi:RimJ/RimL family protein N-acetyltransferase
VPRNSTRWVQPISLSGRYVVLEPMKLKHAAELSTVINIKEYELLRQGGPSENSPAAFEEYFSKILEEGNRVEFIMRDSGTGGAVGHTSYMNIREGDRALEIGHTVIGARFQGMVYNTESKYLLLSHAFEKLGAVRVQIKTDTRNRKSQAAIEKLGAVREGVLRSHDITASGYVRDVVLYSVIAKEWPKVKEGLIRRIEAKTLPRRTNRN